MSDALHLPIGQPFTSSKSGAFDNNFVMNQAADKLAWVCMLPEGMTITRLGAKSGTLTGTSPTYKISLQGVSVTTGAPDGTVLGGASPASKTFTVGASNTWTWHTLDNAYAAARGQIVAVVVEHSSGTIDGSNNSSFTATPSSAAPNSWLLPGYLTNDNGAGWTKGGGNALAFGIGSASRAYGCPYLSGYEGAINTGSTPDEAGIKFTMPAGWGDTFQVVGVVFDISFDATGTTADLILYDSDGSTVLQSVTIDCDQLPRASGGEARFYFDEATLATLSFGTAYRLTLKPNDTTTWRIGGFNVAAAADLDAYPCGQNFYATHRADAGAWTDTTTRRVFMGLLLADWTEPAGGGGGPVFFRRGGLVCKT